LSAADTTERQKKGTAQSAAFQREERSGLGARGGGAATQAAWRRAHPRPASEPDPGVHGALPRPDPHPDPDLDRDPSLRRAPVLTGTWDLARVARGPRR
jgi:hypothetical protein